MTIIEAKGLKKTYKAKSGPVHALDGLDLSVPQGTVKALLGPNGAGKTTVVKMLTTLIKPATRLTYSARETGCMPHLRNAREITGRYGHGGDDEGWTCRWQRVGKSRRSTPPIMRSLRRTPRG